MLACVVRLSVLVCLGWHVYCLLLMFLGYCLAPRASRLLFLVVFCIPCHCILCSVHCSLFDGVNVKLLDVVFSVTCYLLILLEHCTLMLLRYVSVR